MAPTFAELQSAFQHAILDGDDAVLTTLQIGPREPRDAMLGVYRNAYVSRLVEAIGTEHEVLKAYLGDEAFGEMGAAYVAAHPSRHPSVRWISQSLPTFLHKAEPYTAHPVLGELAALEKALNDAFDAADAPVLQGADLAGVAPEAWHGLVFVPHPSAQRLTCQTNAGAIWTALREDAMPPDAEDLAEPDRFIVWRHDATPMIRPMTAEEAMMWDEAIEGVPFGQLCIMLATFDDAETAAGRAAGYLGSWVEAGLLSEAHP